MSQQIKIRGYKILGMSVIYSPMTPPSLVKRVKAYWEFDLEGKQRMGCGATISCIKTNFLFSITVYKVPKP